ncbi:unnamed protein product, partial [Symbiodinium sp. CCMP2456]
MDAVTFDCFMPDAQYDVIALQEIHHGLGKQSSQWHSAGWRFVTSIDGHTRFQGLATLVRRDLVQGAELHQQELAVGRLLHVRISRDEYNIDVLNIYQHAYQQDSSGNNLSKRHQLWDKLNTTVQGLARRNMLVLLGDFNCTPKHVQGHTGYELSRAELYADAAEFSTVLEANQLIVLNTCLDEDHWILLLVAAYAGTYFQSVENGRQAFPCAGHLALAPWLASSFEQGPHYNQALRVDFEQRLLQLQAPTLQQVNDLRFDSQWRICGELANVYGAGWHAKLYWNNTWRRHEKQFLVVRIHGKKGELLTYQQEHQTMIDYFQDLFQSQSDALGTPVCSSASNYHITAADFEKAICSLKMGKAVPPSSAPTSAVRACSDIVSRLAADQDCGAKAYAKILKEILLREVVRKRQLPESLIIVGKSAISIEAVGGIQLAIDLSTAFDMVPRDQLCCARQWAGVVLGIRGAFGVGLLAPHIHGTASSRRLVLGPPHQQLVIPIKDSMTYLGVQISYGNFEDATVNARLAVAQSTRGRLIKVLHACRTIVSIKCPSANTVVSAAGLQSTELALQSAAELRTETKDDSECAPFEQDSVQRLIATAEWKNILQLPNMSTTLQHHCVLCNQLVAKAPSSMVLHVKAVRQDLMLHWDNAMAHSLTLREGHARPCSLPPLKLSMEHLEAMETPSTQVDQEVGDILGAAVDTLFKGRRDEEMPQASARASAGPLKFPKPAGKGQGQGQHNPTGSQEAGQDPGQSSEQGSDPRQWTRERTRQRQDEMWRQWESDTAWYQNEELKKLRREMGYLQEQMRLFARMSLRHEDELSQMRTERDFVLTFEPPTQAAEGNESNMLGLLFRMAVVWKEKKEAGQVDSSLRM